MTVMGNTIARDCVCVCESRIQPDCAKFVFLEAALQREMFAQTWSEKTHGNPFSSGGY